MNYTRFDIARAVSEIKSGCTLTWALDGDCEKLTLDDALYRMCDVEQLKRVAVKCNESNEQGGYTFDIILNMHIHALVADMFMTFGEYPVEWQTCEVA